VALMVIQHEIKVSMYFSGKFALGFIVLASSIEAYTGLFISPSGISDFCGTVTGMVTPKGNMITEEDTLQFSVLPYKCSICPLLVTRQMSNLAIFANSKTQNGFYSLSTSCFVTTAP
jgi:hypothetical protein